MGAIRSARAPFVRRAHATSGMCALRLARTRSSRLVRLPPGLRGLPRACVPSDWQACTPLGLERPPFGPRALPCRALTCARTHLACALPLLSPLSKKSISVSNYTPYPCVLLSFRPPLPCGIVGCALTWHVRALACARPHLACAHPHLECARPQLACARPLRPPLPQKLMSVSNFHPFPCVLLSFCPQLPCGIIGCALTWQVRALSVRPSPKSQCRCPATPLIRAYCCLFALRYLVGWLGAPSLGMCVPSLVRVLTWHVHALTWHVRPLTCARLHLCAPSLGMCAPSPGMCAPSPSAPLQKINVGVQLPPLSVRIAVFLPSATLWDSWVRPHLCACSLGTCTPSPGTCAPSPGTCAPSLVRALTWHVHALSVRPSPKSQRRCPTTPLIRAYCCLFALRYLVG